MGYTLTINRKNNWEDIDEESNITLEEWLRYIDTDEELEFPLESNLTDYNRDYYLGKPGYCEWISHSTYNEPFARSRFDYHNGSIYSDNVDNETILKMVAIAERLNAKVIGQEGEFYDEDDAVKVQITDDKVPGSYVPASKKPWWKFW